MAAKKNIRGLTIEIGGDTTKLDKALTEVDKQSKTTQTALKEVNKLLKLDPTNTELLRQKQELLAQSLDQSTQKAEALQAAVEQHTGSNVNYAKWEKAQASLQRKMDQTIQVIKDLEEEQKRLQDLGFEADSGPLREVQGHLETTQERAQELQEEMETTYESLGRPIPVDQYDALKRELIGVEQQAEEAKKAFDGFDATRAAFAGNMDEISGKAGKVSEAFAPVSKAIVGIGAAALATVPATDNLRSGLSMLEANANAAGVSMDVTEEALRRFYQVSGDVDASIEAISNLLQAGFDDNSLLQAVDELSGAVIAFPETLKIESLADSLQETMATGEATGQYAELLERLGVNLDTVKQNLDMATTAEQQQLVVIQELARGGLSELNEEWRANNQDLLANRDATWEFQKATAQLAETILPLMTTLTELVSGLVSWFAGLPKGVQATILAIGALIALISPVAGIIGSIATAMGVFATASGAAAASGAAVSLTLGQWLLIIGAVAAAIAGLIVLLNQLFGKKEEVADLPDIDTSPGKKGKVQGFANGGVFEPNAPMLGILGDNRTEREIAAPESALIDTFNRALDARGGGGATQVNIRFSGSLAQLGRLLQPVITTETGRKGSSLAPGTGGSY